MPTLPAETLESRFGFAFPAGLFRFQEFARDQTAGGAPLEAPPLSVRLANLFRAFEQPPRNDAGDPDVLETRLYKDPPEFITALLGDTDGVHWGYYVDDPADRPSCVARYYHNDAYQLTAFGGLFDAVNEHAKALRRTLAEYVETDPDSAESYRRDIVKVDALLGRLAPLAAEEPLRRSITAPTRDGMGIVVPPDRYAPLAPRDLFQESRYVPDEAEVRRLHEAALKALKSGYAGSALKLGKDLWDYPGCFDVSCELLDAAYEALGRQVLRDRLRRIRDYRRKTDAGRPPGPSA